MDKSKQIVGIAKNGRIFPFGSIKKEAINEVEVSVSNGTGAPSATAEIVGRKLILNFENLKGDTGDTGVGIASVTPTSTSEIPGATNIYTVNLTNGTAFNIIVKNGTEGPQGVTSVYDSTTQNFLTTLETTTGQSETTVMTQKAVTDAVETVAESVIPQVFLTEAAYDALVENEQIDSNTIYNIYE